MDEQYPWSGERLPAVVDAPRVWVESRDYGYWLAWYTTEEDGTRIPVCVPKADALALVEAITTEIEQGLASYGGPLDLPPPGHGVNGKGRLRGLFRG